MHALLRVSILTLVTALAAPVAAQSETEPDSGGGFDASEEAEAATQPGAEDRSPIDGVKGLFGIGYFTGSAPVGMRYWMDRDSALDFGIDAAFSSGAVDAHRYGAEVGYVRSLAHYHYAVVFARLGLGYRFVDSAGDEGAPERHDINGNLFLGAELFLGAFGFPNVSLQGGYGIEASYTYQGGSAFLIGTSSGGLSLVTAGTLGFHIYF